MIKDLRYIVKKIIIGVGIIVGVSFIRSCKVYASYSNEYENYFYNEYSHGLTDNHYPHSVGQKYKFIIDNYEYDIEYKQCDYSFIGLYINNVLVDCSNYTHLNEWLIGKWPNSNSVTLYYAKPTTGSTYNNIFFSPTVSNYPDNFPVTVNNLFTNYNSGGITRIRVNFSNGIYENSTSANQGSGGYSIDGVTYYGLILNGYDFIVFGTSARYSLFKANSNNQKWISSNFNSPVYVRNTPHIVSLNPVLNKSDDGMLVSVSFNLQFNYVDSSVYDYYAWFTDNEKLKIVENFVKLNTQSNTTLYVEIKDKQGNTIDSETFNVSGIGMIYNGTYDIQFLSTELTNSDTTNDSDEIYDTINRVDVDITYIPKWINYKYQYQFVPVGQQLDSNNWVLVNDNNAKNNVVYTTHENGTLYARILDLNDNVLKENSFVVSRIGDIKTYDKNSGKIFTMFNKLNNDINFGGPISNLIVLPVNVLTTILQTGNNMCSTYHFGSIWGKSLSMPCINPQDYLGSYLWTLIDLIFSGCLIFSISKWLTSLYWNFLTLSNTPDIDSSKFGDRRDIL